MLKPRRPSYLTFNAKSYPWKKGVDYKKHPEKYRVGRGEQGVLIVEPYKSLLVKHWRFKTPAIARKSSVKLLALFRSYLKKNDFVGADMARKFLQMGYTRARRYANYKGGKKYDKAKNYKNLPRGTGEALKAESAAIFHKAWLKAAKNPLYLKRKKAWQEKFSETTKR